LSELRTHLPVGITKFISKGILQVTCGDTYKDHCIVA
jgi:hypothetical protein